MTHAKLAPSASSRWSRCPASVKMSEGIENKSNPAAELGVSVHECGEVCLTTGVDADTFIGKHFNDIEVTQKMADDAQLYVDYVRSLLTETSELLVEQRIDLTMVAAETFGSSDAVVLEGVTLHIVDYKNGRGTVYPDENSQLMLYALGAFHEHDMFYEFENVVLHIVQPNASTGSHCSSWNLSTAKLLEFGEFIMGQAKLALSDNPPCIAGAIQCQWCDVKADCATLKNFALEAITGEFDDLDEVDVDDSRVSLRHLGEILKNKKLIADLLKAYEERALRELESGEEIDGFKLVETRKNKSWINSIDAYDKLKTWFKVDEITTSKLLTPTQISKLIGKSASTRKQNIFEAMWEVPDGIPTIAPSSDKRQAIVSPKDVFEELD